MTDILRRDAREAHRQWPVYALAMVPITVDDVRAAAARLNGALLRTPCDPSPSLSELCGCNVLVKREYLHPTGSFKERGARNALLQLDDDAKARGVIAASAGNHAQALAYHGRDLGIGVTVVMPKWAPLVKIGRCRAMGAAVILLGDTFDAARRHAMQLRDEQNLTYVHGYNDPAVIAGAGTVGLELLEQAPAADAIVIPVGGGGLVAGTALAVKAARRECEIFAVEAETAPTLTEALRAGQPVDVDVTPSIADGLAITRLGDNCFDACRRLVDDVVQVGEADTARAVLQLLELEKAVVEGAGATSLAAVTGPLRERLAGKTVVLLLCGGNIDVSVLGRVIERGLAADGRITRVTVRVSDRAGSLARVLDLIGRAGGSVREVYHDRSFGPPDVGRVDITLVLDTHDLDHIAEVHAALESAGVRFTVPPRFTADF